MFQPWPSRSLPCSRTGRWSASGARPWAGSVKQAVTLGCTGKQSCPSRQQTSRGRAHHASPGGAAVGGIGDGGRHPYPADEHPPPFGVQGGLGGVEIKAPVHKGGGGPPGPAWQVVFVKGRRHPGGLVGVGQPVRRDAHGGSPAAPTAPPGRRGRGIPEWCPGLRRRTARRRSRSGPSGLR